MKKSVFVALIIFFISFPVNGFSQDLVKVTYGQKDGMDLVMGVKKPAKPNRAGVIMVVSGGFRSSWQQAQKMSRLSQPLTDHGYTLFFVIHGSMPRYAGLDAISDVRRAVRFIRHNAATFGIDGNRLGITGGSSGGQTALCIATQADEGNPDADDPVERESSCVQAVACFFPLTDFVNWDFNHDAFGLGPKQRANISPFAHTKLNPENNTYELITDPKEIADIAYRMSPYYFVDADTPPVFIAHGDADKAIALDQSTRFIKKMKEYNRPAEIVVKPGGGHGEWPDMQDYYQKFADWYNIYLK